MSSLIVYVGAYFAAGALAMLAVVVALAAVFRVVHP